MSAMPHMPKKLHNIVCHRTRPPCTQTAQGKHREVMCALSLLWLLPHKSSICMSHTICCAAEDCCAVNFCLNCAIGHLRLSFLTCTAYYEIAQCCSSLCSSSSIWHQHAAQEVTTHDVCLASVQVSACLPFASPMEPQTPITDSSQVHRYCSHSCHHYHWTPTSTATAIASGGRGTRGRVVRGRGGRSSGDYAKFIVCPTTPFRDWQKSLQACLYLCQSCQALFVGASGPPGCMQLRCTTLMVHLRLLLVSVQAS